MTSGPITSWQMEGGKVEAVTDFLFLTSKKGFPGGFSGKEPTCQYRRHRDLGSIPGWGRSPGGGNGNPLQYSGLENSRDYIIHGVTKGQTRLSDFHFTSFHFIASSSQKQASFNFMAAVAICSDFGGNPHQKKVSHCFHCFLIYFP